jgi:hypothetical protein
MPDARRSLRRGIILPAVLAALVALALLSALALFDAVQEWRVAGLADDQVVARAALQEGLDELTRPTDLALLCVSPALARQMAIGPAAGGGEYRLSWWHLGDGLVRAEVEGRGRLRARARAIALLRPDSSERVMGLYRCPSATGLRPAGTGWLTTHPEG